jgi:hypothetical protein
MQSLFAFMVSLLGLNVLHARAEQVISYAFFVSHETLDVR